MDIDILDIRGLPVFNQDDEDAHFPDAVKIFREQIQAADGILIATPEFNRTTPAPLKNFLDWSSRPESEPLPWDQKPVAILGASTGARGASFAQYDVRRVMSYFNARVLGQPEVYVGLAEQKFDADSNLKDDKTKEVLKKFLAAFSEHIKK
jgi:chromate reductase